MGDYRDRKNKSAPKFVEPRKMKAAKHNGEWDTNVRPALAEAQVVQVAQALPPISKVPC